MFLSVKTDLLNPGFLSHLLTGQLAQVASKDLSPQEKWNVTCFAAISTPKADGVNKELVFLIKEMNMMAS